MHLLAVHTSFIEIFVFVQGRFVARVILFILLKFYCSLYNLHINFVSDEYLIKVLCNYTGFFFTMLSIVSSLGAEDYIHYDKRRQYTV